jgi:hypothetical protein
MPEMFIYVQQEVFVMAHTHPCLPKENMGLGSGP